MSAHLERAYLLRQQDRFTEAEKQLRMALAEDPDDPRAHAILAECLNGQERYKEATESARTAVRLAPDLAMSHNILALTLAHRNRFKEARAAVDEAIRIEPDEVLHLRTLATIEIGRERWREALEAADRALAIDPEHVDCLNIRALALHQLGRGAESIQGSANAVAEDPESAFSHANHGWSLLRRGQSNDALVHFREALRIEPTFDWAREGLAEAVKSRNAIYRLLLRYAFWMSRLSSRARWGFIIGLYLLFKAMRAIGKANPDLEPYLIPAMVAYALFVMTTWIGDPLANLVLRLSREGRLALSQEAKLAANLVGICLLFLLIFVIGTIATQHNSMLIGGLLAWLIVIPVSSIFNCSPGWPRRLLATYTIAIATLGIGAIALEISVGPSPDGGPYVGIQLLRMSCLIGSLVGAVLSPWIANILVSVTPRH